MKAQDDTQALEAETEAGTMEAEAVAWGEAASDFFMAHAALSSCENKITFCERSYAHCSMCRYVHARTPTCACVSHLMEGNARLNLSKHHKAEDLFGALFDLYMGGIC